MALFMQKWPYLRDIIYGSISFELMCGDKRSESLKFDTALNDFDLQLRPQCMRKLDQSIFVSRKFFERLGCNLVFCHDPLVFEARTNFTLRGLYLDERTLLRSDAREVICFVLGVRIYTTTLM